MSAPLLHGQTMRLTEERKNTILSPLGMSATLLPATMCLVMGSLYYYVGSNIIPSSTCADPWPFWYKVEGIVSFAEAFVSFMMMYYIIKLRKEDDCFTKYEVYTEQGREEEAKAAMAGLVSAHALDVASMGCNSCVFGLLTVVDLCWFAWGVSMWISDSGCEGETTYLKYLICFAMACSAVSMTLMKCAGL
eukprot:TRINITY_DN33686_c0_g1_i1.p1 TRINITY_DN33686_c0_g1~~TRINITY_DN33686_c0_g1_i1.p1  ORF type:complete len:191 (+),score=24.29 TRINITY_DN33686_c0_g1_i1:90-662(+)